MPLKKYVPNV
jgi:hypothetical protein